MAFCPSSNLFLGSDLFDLASAQKRHIRVGIASDMSGARELKLDTQIGNFEVGKEADFIIINPDAKKLTAQRMAHAKNIDERLFALMILGDDRHVSSTFILGEAVYTNSISP